MECLLEKTRPEKITFAFTMMLNLQVFFNESDWDTMADHQLSSSILKQSFGEDAHANTWPTSPNIPMEILPGEATWQLVDVKEMSKNGAQFVRGCGARSLRQVHKDFGDMFVHLVVKWRKKRRKLANVRF